MDSNVALQDELDDVVLRGRRDLGIDIVLRDDIDRNLILVQTKNRGCGLRPKSINVDSFRAFLASHKRLQDLNYIESGSDQARELMGSYKERVDSGWKALFYYITTAKAADDTKALCVRTNEDLEVSQPHHDIRYRLYDRSELRTLFDRTKSLDKVIPDEIVIDLPSSFYFEKTEPHQCLVTALKGNSLRNLYNQKDSMNAYLHGTYATILATTVLIKLLKSPPTIIRTISFILIMALLLSVKITLS